MNYFAFLMQDAATTSQPTLLLPHEKQPLEPSACLVHMCIRGVSLFLAVCVCVCVSCYVLVTVALLLMSNIALSM